MPKKFGVSKVPIKNGLINLIIDLCLLYTTCSENLSILCIRLIIDQKKKNGEQ
jgi:hypothetical protein